MTELVAQLHDPAFWAAVAPGVPVDGDGGAPIAVSPDDVARARESLLRDGYFDLPPVVPEADVDALRDAVLAVRDAGLPPVFVFAYAPAWHVFLRLAALWEGALGGEVVAAPNLWAWVVSPGERGWPPHQDRPGSRPLSARGEPLVITAWIPLTPATPLTGCIYLAPTSYYAGDDGFAVPPQDVRAVPAPPGAVLAWHPRVIHWGGRAAPHAPNPRVALSLELQRADVPPFGPRVYRRDALPDLRARLGIVAEMLLTYAHQVPPDPDLAALAEALVRACPLTRADESARAAP